MAKVANTIEAKLDLTPQPLKRPMDKMALGNDHAALARLARELNAMGGVVTPADDAATPATPGEKQVDGTTPLTGVKQILPAKPVDGSIAQAAEAEAAILVGITAAPVSAEHQRRPQATVATASGVAPSNFSFPPGKLLFFTGAPKAGKSWLAAQMGARVMEFSDPIAAMLTESFGSSVPEADQGGFFHEVYAWGEGLVSQKYPLTASRAFFLGFIRQPSTKNSAFGISLEEFGTSGFWVRSLIARAAASAKDFPKERIVVTDVGTPDQYQQLREAGFNAFHVSCNPINRSGRGGTAMNNPVADAVGRDLTLKISSSPRGPKLWCVWCDEQYPPPSPRLLTTTEFLTAAAQAK